MYDSRTIAGFRFISFCWVVLYLHEYCLIHLMRYQNGKVPVRCGVVW